MLLALHFSIVRLAFSVLFALFRCGTFLHHLSETKLGSMLRVSLRSAARPAFPRLTSRHRSHPKWDTLIRVGFARFYPWRQRHLRFEEDCCMACYDSWLTREIRAAWTNEWDWRDLGEAAEYWNEQWSECLQAEDPLLWNVGDLSVKRPFEHFFFEWWDLWNLHRESRFWTSRRVYWPSDGASDQFFRK